MRKYLNNLTGVDLFGHHVGVNYNDSHTYNTYLSATVSVMTISLMVINLVLLSQAF